MSVIDILESTAKAFPVNVAARLALVGVIALLILGVSRHNAIVITQATTAVELTNAKDAQVELKRDLNDRLDRMEKKLDRLIARK